MLPDSTNVDFLASAFPPLIHVQTCSPHATNLTWLLEKLVHKQADDLPGAAIASAQLAQLMFVHLLRTSISYGLHPTSIPGMLST